jgi:hypothetical protein
MSQDDVLNNTPYEELGEVAFSCGANGKISAGLTSRTSPEVALNYSLTDDIGGVTTVTQPIDSLSGYDATEDMRDFCNGHVVVSPSTPSVEGSSIPPLRILTYFVPVYFALSNVKISSIFLQWDKTGAKFEASGTIKDFDVEISFTDKDGKMFAVSGKSSPRNSLGTDQTDIGSSCNLVVPAGCNTSLPFTDLSVKVSVSQSDYEGLTSERRLKLKPLSEFPHLQGIQQARSE